MIQLSSLLTQDSFFNSDFLNIVSYARSHNSTADGLTKMIETVSKHNKIWRIPMFNEQFCEEFIEEINHFESSPAPKGRPNTMNNYGVR